MITFSIIQKSQLEGANRLDAECYQLEYLKVKSELLNSPHFILGEHAFITDGEHGSPIFSQNSGIRYFSSQFVNEGFINSEETNFIDEKINEKNKRTQLKKGNILLSIVGTIGKAGIIREKDLPANTDRNVATIKITDNKILPEFLTTFLNSRFGISQTLREGAGNIQPIIILSKVRSLLIPQISLEKQEQIASIFNGFILFMDKSKEFYSQAENLLLEELGLLDYKVEDDLSFIVNLSDVKSSHRTDAEYFQPKYQKLFSIIKTHNPQLLGDIASIKKGFEPGSEAYQKEGKNFIRVSNLTKFGLVEGDQKYINDDLYNKLKTSFEPKEDEILLTKDATPGISYLIKEPIEGIISGGILRLKTKTDVNPEYISLVINSIVGQWQAQRDAGGAVIVHWRPEQIKNIIIPILSKEPQQKIADLVRKSHEARKKSKQFLFEAKRKVEEMIEKGET